ncbi:hypothetical protein MFIFM68171_05655 [Madurella fahalii]|uniref:Uncharacterized protein n=1 Tax=Madurella fahalii TaxID=1157608 RepID=A0ABQ0GCN8_9PEZI
MASTWSDDASTMAPPSRTSVKREVNAMFKFLQKERKVKQRFIVAVVRPETIESLERACDIPWWKFWKSSAPLLVTTEDWLQPNIDSAQGDPGCTEMEERRKHKFYLGPSVRIRVGMDQGSPWSSAMRSSESLSSEDKEKLRTHLQAMENADMDGKWWRAWKGPVSAILGLAVAAGKLAIGLEATVAGIFVEYTFGYMSWKAAAAAPKTSVTMTAAGSAILLGVGVAAAVYVIPWDGLFSWFRGFFASIWDWMCNVWAKFKSWLFGEEEKSRAPNARDPGGRSSPMAFS